MALPKSYLTTAKNLESILGAMQSAQAPDKFTVRFLENLGFKSTSDRLIIGVLKSLGFLSNDGTPTDRYFKFLDQTQGQKVLAEGIRDAYEDLFQVNITAHEMPRAEVINKAKTLSQGKLSESVLDKFAMTFIELCKLADFSDPIQKHTDTLESDVPHDEDIPDIKSEMGRSGESGVGAAFGGLHYNIQLILPESRDPRVYDVLFKSLRDHLMQ